MPQNLRSALEIMPEHQELTHTIAQQPVLQPNKNHLRSGTTVQQDNPNAVVGIDASRNRSGGAVANLAGVIREGNPISHGIQKVHIWAYRRLVESLPDKPWLVKHSPPALEGTLLRQVWWQYRCLSKEAHQAHCHILYTTDAATICRFRPMVVMSQDMLSYEPGVMEYFGYTRARLRLMAILFIQNRAMRFANGVIFLTQYAAQVIQRATGKLKRVAIIPHGIDPEFKRQTVARPWPCDNERPIRCVYVSNAAMYKHQWCVVRAITSLRRRGYAMTLVLAGGGDGRAKKLLDDEITRSDPQGAFVEEVGFVQHNDLPQLLANADLFIFASSCENLPVTLLEAMAVGLPIACSNRGPMPEVLADGGVYFDPENEDSILIAVERIINDADLRKSIARRARELSVQYSWARCADETWRFLSECARAAQSNRSLSRRG